MSYTSFSENLKKTIHHEIENILKTHSGPFYAAFDADGTLWDNDMGENFFQYQIDHCQLPELQNMDPWKHYHNLKKEHPPSAYLWLAQINQGIPVTQVRMWAQQAVAKMTLRPFHSQKDLIQWLKGNGIKVYIVTASIGWAVEPAAEVMGLEPGDVLGIATSVENGIVTATQEGPITWREGKAKALLEKTQQHPPLFCSGNTYGDTTLLEISMGLRLAVQSQNKDNDLFREEDPLRQQAESQKWLTHHFNP